MIQRLYVHNFRCLENFELIIKGMPSVLLIGKNGSGKSTIAIALEILQTIGRGVNRMGELEKIKLISPKDFARGRSDVPIRFEQDNGQILVTSHNPEAIRKFSDENTFLLDRKSHLEPTLIRLLRDINFTGDLTNTLISGDIEV